MGSGDDYFRATDAFSSGHLDEQRARERMGHKAVQGRVQGRELMWVSTPRRSLSSPAFGPSLTRRRPSVSSSKTAQVTTPTLRASRGVR